MDKGKVVAWIIAGFFILVLAVLMLTYCICAKMILHEKKQEKQFARAMSISKMMRSHIKGTSSAGSVSALGAFGAATTKPDEKPTNRALNQDIPQDEKNDQEKDVDIEDM